MLETLVLAFVLLIFKLTMDNMHKIYLYNAGSTKATYPTILVDVILFVNWETSSYLLDHLMWCNSLSLEFRADHSKCN